MLNIDPDYSKDPVLTITIPMENKEKGISKIEFDYLGDFMEKNHIHETSSDPLKDIMELMESEKNKGLRIPDNLGNLSFVLKIDPDKVMEVERLKSNILEFAEKYQDSLKNIDGGPFHELVMERLEYYKNVVITSPTSKNRIILLDYVHSAEIEQQIAAYEKIHKKGLTEQALRSLKYVGLAAGIGLAETIASVNRAALSFKSEINYIEDLKLELPKLGSIKQDNDSFICFTSKG